MQISIDQTTDRQSSEDFLGTLVSHFFVLIGAMLLAVQLRLQVSIGQYLPPQYQAEPLFLYPLLTCAALITSVFTQSSIASQKPFHLFLDKSHPFRRYLVSLGIAVVFVLIVLPDVSELQVVYFAVLGLILGILCIALPYRIYIGHPGNSLVKPFALLWQRRALLWIWLRFNIESRYSQRILGILWIILLPVATSAVLSLAFSQLLDIQLNVPYITYYMSAMIPYTLFSTCLLNSTASVIGRIGIIAQVYFPREILVLLTLGEAIVDFFFALTAMFVIDFFIGVSPNPYFGYLILLTLIMVLMALGLMFLISALTVMIRDIPQLLTVIMQLLFFLTPIIYPIEHFPERLRILFVINPIAPIVQGFREIITYNQPPDLISLHYSIVFAGVALIVGYTTFKSFESEMADYL